MRIQNLCHSNTKKVIIHRIATDGRSKLSKIFEETVECVQDTCQILATSNWYKHISSRVTISADVQTIILYDQDSPS